MMVRGAPLHVVTLNTLTSLVSKLPYDGVEDVADIIYAHACAMRCEDVTLMRRALVMWETRTKFHPKRNAMPVRRNWYDCPVYEYTVYHGEEFFRERFCAGVSLVVRLCFQGKLAHVAWTMKRKAFIYVYDQNALQKWVLHKVLNRQDDPFQTWYKHLGGASDDYRARGHTSPQDSFYRLVVPMFGCHRLLRSRTSMRAVEQNDVVWGIIKRLSESLTEFDGERFEWKPTRLEIGVNLGRL